MTKTLYLIRGLPGSGKSTLASKLVHPDDLCEADQFFYHNGDYVYDSSKIPEAHLWCRRKAADRMEFGNGPVAVANTFTRRWEMSHYYELARRSGFVVQEITCRGPWKSIRDVPGEVVKRMAMSFES